MSVATSAAIAASALPAAFAFSFVSSPSSTKSYQIPKPINLSHLSSTRLGLTKNLVRPPSAIRMIAPPSDHKPASQMDSQLPELLTEYMVDMTCEGCVKAIKNKLQTIDGVKNVEVDSGNQVVRILGSSSVKAMTEALEQTGRKTRLIGQGVPEDFLISAAVAEFKGPVIFGVVRFAQVNMEAARVEASFSGLSPGKHGWSINEYGDLTRGAATTGKIYNPPYDGTANEQFGDLGTLDVDEKGEAFYSDIKDMLRVADLIGRALVVYETEDKSIPGVAAAVIARSAGVGENYKKICTCDGTTIWEATNNDFTPSKV